MTSQRHRDVIVSMPRGLVGSKVPACRNYSELQVHASTELENHVFKLDYRLALSPLYVTLYCVVQHTRERM
jgi:hypothetical protein